MAYKPSPPIPWILLGASVMLLAGMIQLPKLDQPLYAAIIALAVAIPGLCWSIGSEQRLRQGILGWVIVFSHIAPLVAIGAVFLHFSAAACVVFAVVSTAAVLFSFD
jgi:hypothetical protein